jgi:hypothetical protein
MISLQANLTDLQKVVATNDATVTGILIAVVLAFGVTIIYLYKNIQTLNKDHMNELRSFNELLLKVNNNYYEFAKIMSDLKGK